MEEPQMLRRSRLRAERFWKVTLRLLAPSLIAGVAVAWARALGEFGATITFAGNIEGRTQTTPLAVYLLLESDPEAAYAMREFGSPGCVHQCAP